MEKAKWTNLFINMALFFVLGAFAASIIVGIGIYSGKIEASIIKLLLGVVGTILLTIILYELKKIVQLVIKKQVFIMENVKRLKISGIASLVETVLWTIDLLYTIFLAKGADVVIVLGLAFMIILFAGVAIAFYILAELIKQATEYKEENELTI